MTAWILLGTLSGLTCIPAAEQPGVIASLKANDKAPALKLSLYDADHIAPLPRFANEGGQTTTGAAPAQGQSSATTGAAPAKRKVPTWVWVAVAAGIGVGVGAGVLLANKQSVKTVAATPSTVLVAGSGVSAGPP